MKKFIITFLAAGLMIISALNLSSCKKTTSSDVDEIPTTYINITDEDVNIDSRDHEFIHCFYCPDPLYMCDHGYLPMPAGPMCEEHYHVHYFTPQMNCTPVGLEGTGYYCIHNGLRYHKHVLSYAPTWHHNDWHLGGGGIGE